MGRKTRLGYLIMLGADSIALAVVVVLGQKAHIFVFLVFDGGVHGLLDLLGVGFCGLLGGFLRLGGLRLLGLSCLLGLGLLGLGLGGLLGLALLVGYVEQQLRAFIISLLLFIVLAHRMSHPPSVFW